MGEKWMKITVLLSVLFLPLSFGKSSSKKMNNEIATLAGGCFWGVEELSRGMKGVVETAVGYTGGNTDKPVYETVKTGKTGHAEAVQITFDPKKTTYEEILLTFFRLHDPTTPNRQGNDIGTQYRSAIFFHSPEQKATAERVKIRVENSKKWKSPLTTEIVPATMFFRAEDYHQKYLEKNKGGYTCHYFRDFTF